MTEEKEGDHDRRDDRRDRQEMTGGTVTEEAVAVETEEVAAVETERRWKKVDELAEQ